MTTIERELAVKVAVTLGVTMDRAHVIVDEFIEIMVEDKPWGDFTTLVKNRQLVAAKGDQLRDDYYHQYD